MFTLNEMAEIIGKDSRNYLPGDSGGKKPSKVVIDSRMADKGSLFVCIKGENADGHDFIGKAAEQGALAALVSREACTGQTPPLPLVFAGDSVAGLGRLAFAWRDLFKGLLIGVTGSAGKTTLKEVLAAIMASHGATSKNFMNLNSQIGLPVSILNADTTADYWVMEAGINEPHDMDELGAILRPDLAVVLNVGMAHLSGLEDRGVAYYKTRLLKHLAAGGRALVSADYPDLVRESIETGADVKYFSTSDSNADYYAFYLGAANTNGHGRYRVYVKQGDSFEVIAPFRGAYGAENVAAASGAAHMAGLDAQQITAGFLKASLPAQRFYCETRGGFTLIDDSYNANPLSTSRMLEASREMAADNMVPLFLAMGEMLELGSEAKNAHHAIGRQIAASGARLLVWKSANADVFAALKDGLKDGGFSGELREAHSPEEFASAVADLDKFAQTGNGRPGGVMLFKGSRSMKLELWAGAFKNNYFCKLEE